MEGWSSESQGSLSRTSEPPFRPDILPKRGIGERGGRGGETPSFPAPAPTDLPQAGTGRDLVCRQFLEAQSRDTSALPWGAWRRLGWPAKPRASLAPAPLAGAQRGAGAGGRTRAPRRVKTVEAAGSLLLRPPLWALAWGKPCPPGVIPGAPGHVRGTGTRQPRAARAAPFCGCFRGGYKMVAWKGRGAWPSPGEVGR